MPAENLHVVIDTICANLFGSEDRRIQNWVDKLCKENRVRYNNRTDFEGFLHEGIFYRPSWFPKGLPDTEALHPELYEEMHKLVVSKAEIDEDRAFIKQILFKLLYPCEQYQDFRDALPECLIAIIPQNVSWARLPRIREPAYTIAGDTRALRQFDKMLPKIELYLATKLLF